MKSTAQTVRVGILIGIFVLTLLLYSLRLMQLQVVKGDEFAAEVDAGWTSTQIVKAARGEILDRNGRPLAVNAIGRDVVFDQAFLTPGSINDVILKLIGIMEEADEGWIDNLPISDTVPFRFLEGYDTEITRLKNSFELGAYATVEDVVYHLRKEFKLEELNDVDFRKVAGVRYEMKQRGFSMAVPYTFASDIKIETVPKIKERSFEIPGVDVVETPIRQYVSGDIAPHIIGQIGPIYREQWEEQEKQVIDGQVHAIIGEQPYKMNDVIGKDGAEAAFESYLKGKDGKRSIQLNSRGDVIDVIEEEEQIPGNTVVLTIDSQLQKVTQDALESKILAMQKDLVNYPPGEGHEADAGAAAVVNVKTGEVLAVATYPSYNLATYQKDYATLSTAKPEPLYNRALSGAYTPGSIFKPVVAVGALTEGVITASETINCERIYTRFTGYQPRCLDFHGPINAVNALRWSCNIFFYESGWRLGIDKINEYAGMFGLGKPTGIELPESVGQVSSRDLYPKLHNGSQWEQGNTIQAAIGQLDTRLTPLQLANYAATLANNGERMKLTLLKSVKSYTFDETIMEHEPEVAEVVTGSPEAFNTVREGMVAASRIGTARSTFGEGVYDMKVASKTGTPETAVNPNSTFIAYAPADDPEIAVCIVIEKGWHGYTGAPVAREIFDAYFYANNGKSSASTNYGTLLS